MNYILGNYKLFLEKILFNLKKSNIKLSEIVEIDHVAYRVTSFERYNVLKKQFEKFGDLISENIIRNRPIAVFKLCEAPRAEPVASSL